MSRKSEAAARAELAKRGITVDKRGGRRQWVEDDNAIFDGSFRDQKVGKVRSVGESIAALFGR